MVRESRNYSFKLLTKLSLFQSNHFSLIFSRRKKKAKDDLFQPEVSCVCGILKPQNAILFAKPASTLNFISSFSARKC